MANSTRYIGLIKSALKGRTSKRQGLMSLKRKYFGLPEESKINLALSLSEVPKSIELIQPQSPFKVINGSRDFSSLGIEFNLFSILSYLKTKPNLIKDHKRTKEYIEKNIVTANLDKCEKALDEFESLYSPSFWTLDVRFSLKNKIKSADDIISHIEKTTKDESEINLLSILFYKHSSSGIDSFLKNHFLDVQKEYKNNDMTGYIDMLSSLLLPKNIDENRNIDRILELSEVLAPFDRYILFKKIFFEYYTSDFISENHKLYNKFIDEVYLHTEDEYWLRIKSIIDGSVSTDVELDSADIINMYSAGLYKEVISHPQCSIGRDLSLMDIKFKSILYTHNESDVDTSLFSSKFESNLFGQISVLHTSPTRYNSIVDSIEELNFRYYALDFIKSIRPSIYSSYPFINKNIYKKSCIEVFALGFNITPRHLKSVYEQDSNKNYIDDCYQLSDSRKLRCEIQSKIETNDLDNIEELILGLSIYNDVTRSEVNYLTCNAYVKRNEWEKLIHLISKECISESANVILYPLKETVEKLEKDIELSKNLDSINCVYLYSIVRDSSYRIKVSELLEDYLLDKQVKKPSELIPLIDIDLSDIGTFNFFFKVCSVEVMSDLLCFTSGKDLLLERLKIVKSLMEKQEVNENYYLLQDEENKIINEILTHSLTVQHNKNKLYINVNGIKKSQLNEYRVRLENIIIFKDMDEKVLESFFDDVKNKEDSENKRNNVRHYIFESIYQKVIHDFIVDGNYGLARSLSSEIRHGVLPNKLRSIFEGLNLVTVLDLDGNYESNIYWRDYLEKLASIELIDYIDSVLAELSRSVDSLILEANSWPTVSEDIKDDVSIFNFAISPNALEKFSNYIEDKISKSDINNYEALRDIEVLDLIDSIESYIWSELEIMFEKIRRLFNDKLKVEFNELIEHTRSKVDVNGLKIAKLNEHLSKANAHIIKEISEIESWFSKPNTGIEGNFYLTDILASSIDCIKGIYNPKVLNINRSRINIGPSNIAYSSNEALGVIRALISIYQNCLSHGKNGSDTVINIDVQGENVISISNEVDQAKKLHVIENNYIEKVGNFSPISDYSKLVSEGGTGLYKIYRNLKDSSSEFNFSVDLLDMHFYQRITI
ncbi:hypothetical protein [Vibrio crassostreae]|uniref:hypothetical protein n=1 Tax=Vibrio crassostreae TaxID=246167 RepID=UPI001B3163DB|nr:hypothetical protein [Vibrio crassostreae]